MSQKNSLKWAYGSVEEIAAALRVDWRARGALTNEEAFGEADTEEAFQRTTARIHKGGAMTRFASEATMRHLKTVGLVHGLRVRNVNLDGSTGQGMMRLWPLIDVLRAEVAISLADLAGLPVRQLGRLLRELPVDVPVREFAQQIFESYAGTWADHALVTLGSESEDPATRSEADSYFKENRAVFDPAERQFDPSLIIADGKWLFGKNFAANRDDLQPFPLGEIIDFRSGRYRVEFILSEAPVALAPQMARERAPELLSKLEGASTVLELNLYEPMRRFVHRNGRRH